MVLTNIGQFVRGPVRDSRTDGRAALVSLTATCKMHGACFDVAVSL